MTTDKRGISALLLQRQLELRRYETAWMMLHKLRRAMVNVGREPLHGEVEIDETWIGGTQAGLRGSRQLKGRRAALMLVAIEKRGKASGRLRMAVIPDVKATTLSSFIQQNVAAGSTIYTHGLKTFMDLNETGYKHIPRSQPLRINLRKGAKSVLSSKVKLGAGASAAAGPKGRSAEAATDIVMKAEILSYSRSRGVFAGVSIEGSTLRSDGGANESLYGKELSAEQIIAAIAVKVPAAAQPLIDLLNKRSPKNLSGNK